MTVPNRVFGGKCGGLLASYDPESSSLRMSQLSLFPMAGDGSYYIPLPKSGTLANGLIYEQVIPRSTRHTNENAYSLLPTPTPALNMTSPSMMKHQGHQNFRALLPTPTTNDCKNTPGGVAQWERHSSLNIEAAKMAGRTKTTIGKDFRLNPRFVEEMMGFPIGWTDLER